ncbi:hypothetical protein [Mannheimia indoligenes]|uniref:hypothetical protein n=1 Tax=Mannheimia indoligenes TaxID=3103145 RepID=UPI003D165BAA
MQNAVVSDCKNLQCIPQHKAMPALVSVERFNEKQRESCAWEMPSRRKSTT